MLSFQVASFTQLLHLVPLVPWIALRSLNGEDVWSCTVDAKALHRWATLQAPFTPEDLRRLETVGLLDRLAALPLLRALGAPV